MKWPPLIESGHLPPWVIARDTLATLAAWALLLYFVRDMAWMLAYWVLATVGIHLAPPWMPGELWRNTLPFLKVVALLVAWLVVFAVARWHLLTNRQRVARDPPPLDASQQADAFHLPADELPRLRSASSATVRDLDPEGVVGSDTTVSVERVSSRPEVDPE